VDLINFDNLVIFGPGSEWLWTMVSSVVLAVTFVAIYRQLRIQSRAAAVEQVQAAYRDWTSEGLTRAKQRILRAIEAGDTPEAMLPKVAGVANFWEAYGRLVRTRNIDGRLLRESFGHAVVLWWTLLADYVALVRERARTLGSSRTSSGWRRSSLGKILTRRGLPSPRPCFKPGPVARCRT